MTSLNLSLWIVGGILLQVSIYLCIGFIRHWQDYRALKTTLEVAGGAAQTSVATTPQPAATAAWTGLRNFKVARKVVEDQAHQICSFYLTPEDGKPLPPFLPGQFLTFKLPVASVSGAASVVRCYSLSDAPQDSAYRVSIKRAPPPSGSSWPPGISSNFFHDAVVEGSTLQVRAPGGHFYIDETDAPVVLIGGGIGITPMLSMLNWSLAKQPGREVWLFYGARNETELMMQGHLEKLATAHPNFHLHICLSDPANTGAGADGSDLPYRHRCRVTVDLFRSMLPLKPYHFYICGPTPMLTSLVPALEDWGVPDARIHFEAFGPASIPRKKRVELAATPATEAAEPIWVHFSKSGKQLQWQPGMASLLDFAEANGISVDSGCRSGSCGTCQTTIRSGEVAYTQTPDSDPEPGNCLMCVCTPKSTLTLEA
jgi:ferredoxin-NADP reductase